MRIVHSLRVGGLCLPILLSGAFQTVAPKRYEYGITDKLYMVQGLSVPDTTTNLLDSIEAQGFDQASQDAIVEHLKRTGLWDDHGSTLVLLAQDFVDRPEVFSSLLISDFEFTVLVAHQTRALAMAIIKASSTSDSIHASTSSESQQTSNESPVGTNSVDIRKEEAILIEPIWSFEPVRASHNDKDELIAVNGGGENSTTSIDTVETPLHTNFKGAVVNDRAQKRRKSTEKYEYGLPPDYKTRFPQLASELDAFNKFMIRPSSYSQEAPIRPATADVYMRHARQFLGWYVTTHRPEASETDAELSIYAIIPNKDKESASETIEFILWLRSRDVSVSYEANILRGLIKLLKFRFAQESKSDPSYGGNTFDDIPIIKEIRKLHRDANKRQRLAPRSSDEQRKWLSWPEYLQVIQKTKTEVLQLMHAFQNLPESERRYRKSETERTYSLDQEDVALAYQNYLILAFFANIPDRQRTIRELEIGRTLVKDKGCWCVKHGPDDYKTGNTYGERPVMQLAPELAPAIDGFLEQWRPALRPSTDFLFVQSRTGKPLTGDSVFQRVSRCCFKYTGKRTNPHLLRDMIVTHVRESDASEKELEALALFMGHSIHMQRTSYDRRTLTSKIAPAVKLMQSVNNNNNQSE
jgi:hypothetical protein